MGKPIEEYFYIQSVEHTDAFVDIDSGAKLVLAGQRFGSMSQWWTFVEGDRLRNAANGLVVTFAGSEGQLSLNPQDSTSPPSQAWKSQSDGSIACAVSGFVMDDYAGRGEPGTPVIGYQAHGGANQQWHFIPAELALVYNYLQSALEATPRLILANAPGGAVIASPSPTCDAAQLWYATPDGCLRCQQTGFALTAVQLQQVQCAPQKTPTPVEQRWAFDEDTGYWRSELPGQGATFVLDVADSSAKPGTPVLCWTKNNPASTNQIWSVEPGCLG